MNDRGSPPQAALRYGLLFLVCLSAAVYFQWRLGVLNGAAPAFAWFVYLAELIGLARTLLFLVWAARVPRADPLPAPLPDRTVDVFVPTLSEPLFVVRRTLMAAQAIRYPHATWLLDDGGRAEMRQLADELGCRYLARTEHDNHKPGNLNHALRFATGEFVAIFDADNIAHPDFLDNTLGYFIDERLAYVQTPHEVFNVDSFEHLAPKRTTTSGASFFHHVLQRSRGGSNASFYSGSAAVLRRTALDAISGFATGTLGEDIHSSFRFHAAGWHSRYHGEVLSAGMGPHTGTEYFKQRLRWAQDAVQLLACENILTPRLTPQQRQAYFTHVLSHMEGWRHAVIYALPLVMLVTGVLPVAAAPSTFLAYFAPYFASSIAAITILGRGHGRPDQTAVYNLARTPASIVATFTAWHQRRFVVTPKQRGNDANPVPRFWAWGVALTMAGAIAFAVGMKVAGHSRLSGGTLAILAAWAAYHLITAVRLIRLERRCERDRRARTRFPEALRGTLQRLDAPEASRDCEIVTASAEGVELRPLDGSGPIETGRYALRLEAAGTHAIGEFVPVHKAGGRLIWPSEAAETAFDALLHDRAVERLRQP